jgi:hypothetical protein
MKISTLQQILESMLGADFEKFVFDLLQRLGRFDDIQLHAHVHGFEVDIVAKDRTAELVRPTTWYIETTVAKVLSVDKLRSLSALTAITRFSTDAPARVLVVASGSLTSAAKEYARGVGIEVWDGIKLAQIAPQSLLLDYLGISSPAQVGASNAAEKANSLSASLRSLNPGRDDSLPYQRLVSEMLEFMFCPPLETPHFEIPDAQARNRRDIILENAAPAGFWAGLRHSYSAHYIVVDAKNYSQGFDKQPVLDIAHYLKPYGCGMFGLLATRKGASEAGLHAIREQWIGNHKMIVALDDDEMHEMLRLKGEAALPEEIIRAKIASFRMSL